MAEMLGIGPNPNGSKPPVLPLDDISILAGALGIEPNSRRSELLVLPVNDTPIQAPAGALIVVAVVVGET